MRMTDKCWKLARFYGLLSGTVSELTRGDSTTEEFFMSEAEAWRAEAERCAREAERNELDAATWREREAEALRNSKRP